MYKIGLFAFNFFDENCIFLIQTGFSGHRTHRKPCEYCICWCHIARSWFESPEERARQAVKRFLMLNLGYAPPCEAMFMQPSVRAHERITVKNKKTLKNLLTLFSNGVIMKATREGKLKKPEGEKLWNVMII